MRRFFAADAVAVGHVLAKNAVNRAIDEEDLHLAQQVVDGGHFVPTGNGRRLVHRAGQHDAAGQHVAQRVDQPLAALE